MQTAESFLKRVEAAIEAHGISARQFGWDAIKDPSFVRRLREKKGSATLKTVERIDAFIAKLERASRKKGKAA